MRLGSIQRDIVAYLSDRGERGAFIRSSAWWYPRGYELAQVERSITALLRRGVVKEERLGRYILAER